MDEIELSVMARGEANEQVFANLLETFESQKQTKINLQALDWMHGRSELVKVALYHHGPDVSEIGTSWISDLIAMNALRPFSPAEVEQLGGKSAFLPETWKSVQMANDPQVWSIPWLAEALVLHYRRDILAQIGIDEAAAFCTQEQLYDTVRRLKEHGYTLPIAVPNRSNRHMLLHAASSWIWQAGGDFMSPDGRQVIFNSTQGIEGLTAFMRLLLTIAPEGMRVLDLHDIGSSYREGLTPIAISGLWLNPSNIEPVSFAKDQWGTTRLPGPPFVGGSNLVIWKHSRHERAAMTLIQSLTSENISIRYGDTIGMVSSRVGVFEKSRFAQLQVGKVGHESIQNGRTFPTQPLWGMVEDRLATAIVGIWDRLYDHPELDAKDVVTQILNQLARSLNLTLSQR